MVRQYRAGSRQSRYRDGAHLSENRIAWITTIIGNFAIMAYPPDDEESEEDNQQPTGTSYKLAIQRGTNRPLMLNLTALTHAELEVLRALLNLVIDLAEPVVIDRDREAAEGFAKGDDSFTRSYRRLPDFIVRSRTFGADCQELLLRLAKSATGRFVRFDTPPESGGSVDAVADGQPPVSRS